MEKSVLELVGGEKHINPHYDIKAENTSCYPVGEGFTGIEINGVRFSNIGEMLRYMDKQREQLEKENAELKDYRLTTLAKQQTEMSKYALNLEHKLSWYDDQLTKAKEIIREFVEWATWQGSNCPNFKSIQDKAEQFLSEVEK